MQQQAEKLDYITPLPHFECIGHAVAFFEKYPESYDLLGDTQKEVFSEGYKNYLKDKAERPIYYFRPLLPQLKLITTLNKDGHIPRTIMLEGANKTGKSTLGVAFQIAIGVGFFPWLEDPTHYDWSRRWKIYRKFLDYCGFESYEQLKDQFFQIKGKLLPKLRVPNVNLAIGETFTESVDKDLVPKYLELIPKQWKPDPKKNQQGVIHKITLKAGPGKGTIFYFRSYKSHESEFEGIDTSGSILYNEPPPQSIVTAVNRGAMPYDARVIFAYTALKEAWIYRDYVNRAKTWLI